LVGKPFAKKRSNEDCFSFGSEIVTNVSVAIT